MTPEQILAGVETVVLVDWPSREVPDTLVRAGYFVVTHGGPEPDDWSVHEQAKGRIVARRIGRAPDRAQLVYVHRPLGELPGMIDLARSVGATALWFQSGRNSDGERDPKGCWSPSAEREPAEALARVAGLKFVHDAYIAAAVRRVRA